MNMFHAEMAFSLELIALGVGAGLIIWAARSEGPGIFLGKLVGYVILIVAFLTLLCSSYFAFQYWKGDDFHRPAMMKTMKSRMMQKGSMPPDRVEHFRPAQPDSQTPAE